jgi:hypothetical protein
LTAPVALGISAFRGIRLRSPLSCAAYFQGVQELAPQAIAHDELAAMAFTWTFEMQPSYAVP